MDAFVPSCHPAVPLPETAKRCGELVLPHVESFNYFVEEGLPRAVEDLPAREFVLMRPAEVNGTPNAPNSSTDVPQGPTVRLWIENATVGFPSHKHSSLDARMFPWHARESGQNYAGPLTLTVARRVGDGDIETTTVKVGDIPIMVRSSRCNLAGMSPAELTQHNEEAVESGGYFICNGIERIFRMLQVPRRNYAMAVTRSAYQKRGPLYSNKGIMIRCVRPDQSGVTLTLHYLNDGSAKLRFSLKKQEFFVPLVLVVKCLADLSDREFYERCLGGDVTNAFLSDAVTILLRDHKRLGLATRRACLEYLGQRFRSVLDIPQSLTDAAAGQMLMDRYILVHLADDNAAKVDLLVLMARKLYGFVAGDVVEDNADSLMNQEILLPGHLYTMFIKEKLAVCVCLCG
jgi:DNA-directed RNA polymerase I subunit RPA2